jgi:nucleoside-diphosphate-sugar epimerase
MSNRKIAILGSTSHIAKGLISNFLREKSDGLCLYSRSSDKIVNFLGSVGKSPGVNCVVEEGYKNFAGNQHDVIINCVGAGTPKKLQDNYSDWFTVTEEYDNMVIAYLRKNPDALYVNFSSGAVYGSGLVAPVSEDAGNSIRVNNISSENYYSIVRLNSETKHRSFGDLKIADVRVFAYFSRFIDLGSGYFMTDILNCILNKKVLETNTVNIVRDYVHPEDLFALIQKCMNSGKVNTAFDAISTKPVGKSQILDYFSAKYSLKYKMVDSLNHASPNGMTTVYCSNYNRAASIGYKPVFSSMDTIEQESEYILEKQK